MPATTQPDPSLLFLHLCIQNSDLNKIDFAAVGAATGLNIPAVRMRYSRLKKSLESSIVDGKVNLNVKSAENAAPASAEEQPDASPASPSSAQKKKNRVAKRKVVGKQEKVAVKQEH
ncbi:hypothetical protein ARAM_001252 [Aspergillus rambellii]|uniref:Myb-like DNA-binding domain-containing protein n=1 Tax=Aspergillus rambellii TaxID=308745 RepID=A0A0F8XCF2_9EURO|nr:hypothetical protein ARAM_001252 [Aspergillus rambellii]